MMRFVTISALAVVVLLTAIPALIGGNAWWVPVGLAVLLLLLGSWDVLQRRHSVLRNYPVVGHLRFLLEAIRPEIQQYFIEPDFDGRPYNRETRSIIYERAKGIHGERPYGTQHDINRIGYEYLVHSTTPVQPPEEPHRVHVGGAECRHPYEMSLFNISGMSFGALSGNALEALNKGAALGGFAHDTGEGGISAAHLTHGGDLVWELGTGYFGARTDDGGFDAAQFTDAAAHESVRAVSLKLSQGAKPGLGGVLPGEKVTAQIAAARGVRAGEKVVSPSTHTAFGTPRELVGFLARLRELSDAKPIGFKLCLGERREFLAICKAMREEQVTPDFIIVDGAEGGTGAAPLEYENRVGAPLTEGLITIHNALVGSGLRDSIALGASGKVATGADLVKRLTQGADYTNAARAMMMAVGCLQTLRCHTNHCPVGVATQDPRRARALDVEDKALRVERYHRATVDEATQIMASMGVDDPRNLSPAALRRRVGPAETRSYAQLHQWLAPGELAAEPPPEWAADWAAADPDRF